jgi:hypothetical protein
MQDPCDTCSAELKDAVWTAWSEGDMQSFNCPNAPVLPADLETGGCSSSTRKTLPFHHQQHLSVAPTQQWIVQWFTTPDDAIRLGCLHDTVVWCSFVCSRSAVLLAQVVRSLL